MANQRVHEFAEKVVLITDGRSAVARAAALQLAMQGAFVIACSPDGGPGNVADELSSLGTLAFSVNADAATADGAMLAAKEAEERFGRLDLLVNCIGTEADPRQGRSIVDAAIPLMSPRPSPKIVNVITATAESREDRAFTAKYDAAKEITESLSSELPANFRVNCLVIRKSAAPPAPDELIRRETGVSPDDSARVVTFLLSSEAKALNGQVLTTE